MTLRQKLLLAQAPLGLAVALLGLAAVLTISSLGRKSDEILQENYRSVLAVQKIKEALERLDSAALFLIAGQREKGLAQAESHHPRLDRELRVVLGNITEPGEGEAVARLEALWVEYQQRFETLFGISDPESARDFYFRALAPLFLDIKETTNHVLALNQDAMVRKSELARQAARRMNTLMIAAAVAALFGGLVASSTLTSRLLRPLSGLSRAARRVGEGDYEVRADDRGKDEIARLAADFNVMVERLRAYKKSSLGKLLQAQKASQAAIDSLPDPVVVLGLSGEILARNQAAEALFTPTLPDPAAQAALAQIGGHVLGGKGPYVPRGYEEALRITSREGERYLLPRANPMYGGERGILGVTVLFQDITRLKRFDELKNNLVATVAHELRTPLTSLRMAIHLCIEQVAGPLTEKQADLLSAAREDCERLRETVDELLDLARIQSGRLEVMPRPVAAAPLLSEGAEGHRVAAEERKVRLLIEAPPELGSVLADPERILLVFSNLLSNALRYSPEGAQVVLAARPSGAAVRFEVRDEGPGIPVEQRARIFEKFVQLPDTAPGTAGLGLFLSREIVRAHGGEIGVESEAGRGSSFWFTLPAPQNE